MQRKREKNVLDFPGFGDCLKILVDHSPRRGRQETQAAKELAGRFAEVMIDEYQDSNLSRKKLLNVVSKMRMEATIFSWWGM